MKKRPEYTLTQTEVTFGDALCRLYRFAQAEDYAEKTSHVPILHRHAFYEVMLCPSYPYHIALEKKDDVHLTPGTCFLIAQGKLHCAVGTAGKPPISFGLSVEKVEGTVRLFRPISDRLQGSREQTIRLSDETKQLFETWRKSDESTLDGFCESKVLAYRFLYAFFRDISLFGKEKIRAGTENRAGVAAHLDTLLDDRRYNLKEIAHALGYTRKHTLRLIRQRYGCDYRTVKERKALEAAKIYLTAAEDMSVKEIADALGYGSESAFYAFFKRTTGFTPKQYRKLWIEGRRDDL